VTGRQGDKGTGGQEECWATVEILGVRVDCVGFEQTLDQIGRWIDGAEIEARERRLMQDADLSGFANLTGLSEQSNIQYPISNIHQICTMNPEFIMTARRDPLFADVLRQADLCVPDGVGVLWAARRQGVQVHERVTGSDGIYQICRRATACGWSVYFLGAAEGVAEEAGRRLATLYPGLRVSGAYGGSPHEDSWPEIAKRLTIAQPDILFVAYGHPRQDLWIAQHRQELPVKVALGIGGAFDFVAGVIPRAPQWAQQWGVEWLYRLLQQPWRWRRMAVLPWFVLRVFYERAFEKGERMSL